ncbi:ATP-binding protein [Microbacterium sp. RURRCA19A]|uniref:ATP-binding protein n=1 Tax=Microbacterium sp. RURRCA19A TaxID=1907391 RepID=UPI000955DABA|nr:ATP-binding protein [Microbacterium sp. RURRCA19A]SIR74319.1 Histidine kinase-like ATPase domain-containing protein [Microbacterium sp. RURRCA19A]
MTVRSSLEIEPTALAAREIGGWLAASLGHLEAKTAAAVLPRAELAVHEACMNVIDHGALPADSTIGLALELGPTSLTVRLTDHGAPFDPSTAAALPAEPLRERGYGLTIIRSLVTEVSYRRVGAVNELELRMEIGGDDAQH